MFEKILEAIKANNSIVIFGHINPDGDCYGSQIGLKEAIKSTFKDKEVYAVGSGLPEFFDFLSPMDEIPLDIIKKSLVIVVDANDLSRMEDNRCYYGQSFIKIDHHIDNGSFKEGPQVVDEDSNSTCELITKFIQECDLVITKKCANALFLGMLTDTGRFQFVHDFVLTFNIASYLCDKGAEPKTIISILNLTEEKSLKVKGYIFSNYKKSPGGTIYLITDKKTLHELDINSNYICTLINLLGNVKGYPCWLMFAENENGTTRVEFRSNGPSVQPIALKHGGGGHLLASGLTLPTFDVQTMMSIVKEVDVAIEEFYK